MKLKEVYVVILVKFEEDVLVVGMVVVDKVIVGNILFDIEVKIVCL